MELVYLWVEKYKNIENQGFNFSPRFTCKYENYALTIEENKDYFHIFPANVNITAIVGKNGSGKSSIIEILLLAYHNTQDKKYIVFFLDNNVLKYYVNQNSFNKIITTNMFPIEAMDITETPTHIQLISALARKYNNDQLRTKIIKISEHYFSNMSHDASVIIKTLKLFSTNSKYISMKEKNISFVKLTMTIFEIIQEEEKVHLLINYRDQDKPRKNLIDLFSPIPLENLLKQNIARAIINTLRIEDLTDVQPIIDSIKNKTHSDFFNILNIFIEKTKLSQNEKNQLKDIIKKAEELFNFLKKRPLDKQEYPTQTIRTSHQTTFEIKQNSQILQDFIKTYNMFINGFSESFYEFQMININLQLDDGISYNDLSAGEQSIFSKIVEIEYEFLSTNHNTYFLLMDEPDNALHPNWSKEFITIILKNIEQNKQLIDKKINFVITTHSPFLISDIPTENIIFLDRDSNGKCKAINGLKDKKQTFGANIHTLLSDTFFMEDGLMGEFAKNKINKAITILNKQGKLSKSSLAYCEQIISIIGEPILKRQLQRMLDSKRLYKMDEIDRLKADISELHQKLKKLENRK